MFHIVFTASRKAAEIVHKEMLSLHPLILEHLDDIGRSQVKKLLERLQVKCLTSRDLIKHHIIPALRTTQNTAVRDDIFKYNIDRTMTMHKFEEPS